MNIKVKRRLSLLRTKCCNSWETTKKLLNHYEQKFAKLETFKSNTQMFQANTNGSLKNLETQVGQLASTLQNEDKDAFPSDTQKNPRDCMAVHLRSGKELRNSRAEKKEKTEQEEEEETGRNYRRGSSKLTVETDNKVKTEQPGENREQKQKEKVQAYILAVPFPTKTSEGKE